MGHSNNNAQNNRRNQLFTRYAGAMTGALVAGIATFPGAADAVVFSDGDFEPGSWTAMDSYFSGSVDNGETQSVTSDRFIGGNPANKFMLQQFTAEFPGGFNSVYAPILMNQFVYNPSTQGAIETISASITTLPAVVNNPDPYGVARVFLIQDDRIYLPETAGENPGFGFSYNDPQQARNFSGYTADQFYEQLPESGIDQNSHPDFNGGPVEFGFGLSLTGTGLTGNPGQVYIGAFDNVSVRMSTVPEPASAALVGLATAMIAARCRRAA